MWPMILITAVLVIALVDMWAFYTGKTATLSRKIVDWTKKWPLLPFIMGLAIGVVAGHWWPISGC